MGIRVLLKHYLFVHHSNPKLSSMIVCIGEERHKERHWYEERLSQERLSQERHRYQERHWHQEKIKL